MTLRLRYLFALASAAMMVACDPENNVEPGGGGGTEDPTRPVYTAKLTDLHNPTIQRKWEKGDKIAVFNTAGMEEYVFEGEDGSLSGTIKATGNGGPSGDPLEKVLAVYPASAAQYIDAEGSIRIRFDDSALIGHETEASIWVASADPSSSTLEFKCITAYLEIPIYGKGEISRIRLISSQKIAGPATVSFSGSVPQVVMVTKAGDDYYEASTLTLSATAGQSPSVGNDAENAWKIIVPLPVAQYLSGISFVVEGILGNAYGSIKSLSSLNAEGLTSIDPIAVEFIKLPPDTTPVPFTDEGIKAFCLAYRDTNSDGVITIAEAKSSTFFVFSADEILGAPYRSQVKSLDDLQYFTGVKKLQLIDTEIPSLRLRNNPNLEEVSIRIAPNLISADFKGAPNLIDLELEECGLSSLDVSMLPALYRLYCRQNDLTELDLSANSGLRFINCSSNHLSSLDVSNMPMLERLGCSNNEIKTLKLSNHPKLRELWCSNNMLNSLDLSRFPELKELGCTNNRLKELDLSQNPKLERLECGGNQLSNLDVSSLPELDYLYCHNSKLESLDLSGNAKLTGLNCASNALTSLDLSKTQKLKEVWCGNNQLSSLDISTLSELEYIDCRESQLERLNMGQNDNLKELICNNNKLTSLDLSKTFKLERLFCSNNKITSLVMSSSPVLKVLNCQLNELERLDLSQCPMLFSLACDWNNLTSLDLSKNTKLQSLWCGLNHLTSLDVSALQELEDLRCWGNEFTSLDISNNPKLSYLDCRSDYLKELWLKKGQVIPELYYNPEVTEIKYKD